MNENEVFSNPSGQNKMDEVQLSDILDLDELQHLQDLFADANGVASLITTPNGIPLTKPSNFTRLCSDFIQKSEKGCVNCMKSNAIIGRQNYTGPVIQHCICEGLRDAGASITVGGMHIANWAIGQVRNEEFDQEQVLKFADEIGAGRVEFLEAYVEVPVMPVEKFEKIAEMLFAFAKEISLKAYTNLQLKKQIDEAEKSSNQLKASEERFQMLFERAPLSYQSLDFNGNLIRINQKWLTMLGYSGEEVIGKWFGDFLVPEFQEKFRNLFSEFKQVGHVQNEFELLHKNGNHVFVSFEGTVDYDSNHEFVQTYCILQDITESRSTVNALRESEERWKRAIAGSPFPIMIHNEDDEVLQLSEGWTKFSGYTIDDIQTLGDWTELAYGERSGLKKEYIDQLFSIDQTKKNGEWIITAKDGSKRIWDFQTTPLGKIHKGKRVLQSMAIDITDQKQAEKSLLQEQKFSNAILESLPGIFYLYSYPELKLVRWNKNHEILLGFNADELRGRHITEWHLPEAEDAVIDAVDIAMIVGQNTIEAPLVSKDKSLIPFILTGSGLEIQEKKYLMGVGIDLTERKKFEEKLSESEQRLQFVLQGSQLGYWDWNLATGEVKRNERWAEMLGYDLEDIEFNVKQWIDFIHPDDQDMALKSIQDHLDGITPMHRLEYRMQHRDGHYVWILDQAQAVKWDSDGKVLRMSGTHTDITDRKMAEEILNKTNAYLENLINYANAPIIVWDTNFKITRFNKAFEMLSGLDESKVLGQSLEILFSEEKAQDSMNLIRKTLTGERWEAVEIEILNLDGSAHTILWNSATIFATDGLTPIATIAQGQDISERVKAEQALLHEQFFSKSLLDSMPGIFYLYSYPDLKLVRWNKNHELLLGYNSDELDNWSVFDWIDIKTREAIFETTKKINEEGQLMLEVSLLTKDRRPIPFILSGVKIELMGQKYIMGVGLDMTEHKKAEDEIRNKNEQLRKINAEKDKFFSIIAHDLRSPFNSFLGLTQIMAEELSSLTMSQIQKIADSMSRSANNLYRLLENLLQWSQVKQGLIPFSPVSGNLKRIIDESIGMAQDSAKNKGIGLVCEIQESIRIFVDVNMFQTILRNLISNAVKFTPRGGQIDVSARLSDPETIEISVKDSGIGMNPEMVNNLFKIDLQANRTGTEDEPSTGLGLLLCKEFVEKHDGRIWAESEEGKGSVFYFTLPAGK